MNKNTNTSAFLMIFGFVFVALIVIFMGFFIQSVGDDYIIEEVYNVSYEFTNNTQTLEVIDEIKTDYDNLYFPLDLYFLGVWVSVFFMSVVSVFQTKKSGIFSFFGFIFVGTLFMLLLTTFLSQISEWFTIEILEKLFDDFGTNTPIFSFYINNLGIINFIWWLLLVSLAVIDRNFLSYSGRVEE